MTKAVLFDFDETLQDRTAAFEKYMDTFVTDANRPSAGSHRPPVL